MAETGTIEIPLRADVKGMAADFRHIARVLNEAADKLDPPSIPDGFITLPGVMSRADFGLEPVRQPCGCLFFGGDTRHQPGCEEGS
jgi:hypothetical protein